jgi:MscS family membrane protein
MDFLNIEILDNNIVQWLKLFSYLLLAIFFKKYISNFLGLISYSPFRKYSEENEVKTFKQLLSKPFQFLILFFTIYFGFKTLSYPSIFELNSEEINLKILLNQILKVWGAIAVTWVVLRIIDFMSLVFYQKHSSKETSVDKQIIPFIKDSIKVIICIISLIIILGVIFKLNVASIIAGIGIGGLAVALASKESIENLLGSFTIFIDKPFTVGDVVKIGIVNGTVEKVGFRSTRIRTENKTYVTVPNKQIVDSVLDNLSERTHRRMDFKLNYSLDTTKQQIESTITEIQNYLKDNNEIENDFTVAFSLISQNGFEILVSLLIKEIEAAPFYTIQQNINFKVLEIINLHGIVLQPNSAAKIS